MKALRVVDVFNAWMESNAERGISKVGHPLVDALGVVLVSYVHIKVILKSTIQPTRTSNVTSETF